MLAKIKPQSAPEATLIQAGRASRSDAHSAPRQTSKAQHIYEAIKEAILSGELAPGVAIDKIALSQRFGVSRFPVSTAIDRLAFDKLVVVEPQHGSFVSRVSLTDVREYMLLRRAIESDIAARAARHASRALVDDLDRNLRYQAAAVEAKDLTGIFALDLDFHRIIVDSLGLAHTADVLDRVLSHLERVRRLLITPGARMMQTLAEHRRIAGAIAAGDPDSALAAARAHIDQTATEVENFARANPTLIVTPG